MAESNASSSLNPKEGQLNMWNRIDLFLASLLMLFLELACIRWIPGHIRLLSYFSNFILLSCFLGMSVGFIISNKKKIFWLTPLFLLILALIMLLFPLTIDIGSDTFQKSIYYGAENKQLNIISAPFPVILVIGMVLIALIFMGVGQLTGRLFGEFKPLEAYIINILGSITGTLVFALFSYLYQPPISWLSFAGVLIIILSRKEKASVAISTMVLVASMLGVLGVIAADYPNVYWSPYNKIAVFSDSREQNKSLEIEVNNIGMQNGCPIEDSIVTGYPLPFLLKRNSSSPCLDDVLIIGSGLGNDISHALVNGSRHIDAVEIDPVIQKLGMLYHPNKPYESERVSAYLTDGRHFLAKTDKKYDMILYGLVDSLTLFSTFSSVRLENYLYTKEAFQEARRHLKPDGILVVYNHFRMEWLAEKIATTMGEAFGKKPLVVKFPYKDMGDSTSTLPNLVLLMDGNIESIQQNFLNAPDRLFYFLVRPHQKNLSINGFTYRTILPEERVLTSGPITPKSDNSLNNRIVTDDWPFLYMKKSSIPGHYIFGILIIIGVSLSFFLIIEKGRFSSFSPRYFFLGAGFMLLETIGVVRFSILYGSTWFNNVIVFTAVLVMVLLANLFMLKKNISGINGVYLLLLFSIILSLPFHPGVFTGYPDLLKYTIPPLLLFLPLFFAGIIFAFIFKTEKNPQAAISSNLLGAMAGGALEYISLLVGYSALIGVILICYIISWLYATRK
jgi:hypothetical protein